MNAELLQNFSDIFSIHNPFLFHKCNVPLWLYRRNSSAFGSAIDFFLYKCRHIVYSAISGI